MKFAGCGLQGSPCCKGLPQLDQSPVTELAKMAPLTAEAEYTLASCFSNDQKSDKQVTAVSLQFIMEFAQRLKAGCLTRHVVQQVVLPSTKERRCSYAMLLPRTYVSTPDFFVSHSWSGVFHDLVEMLVHYCCVERRLSPSETFLWLDVFCVNQHGISGEKEHFVRSVESAISASRETLLCMDAEFAALERLWCLFEVLWTVRPCSATKLVGLVPPKVQLPDGNKICGLTLSQASCSRLADRPLLTSALHTRTEGYWSPETITVVLVSSLASCFGRDVAHRCAGLMRRGASMACQDMFLGYPAVLSRCGFAQEAVSLRSTLRQLFDLGNRRPQGNECFETGLSPPAGRSLSNQSCFTIGSRASLLVDPAAGYESATVGYSGPSLSPVAPSSPVVSAEFVAAPTGNACADLKRKRQHSPRVSAKRVLQMEDVQACFYLPIEDAAVTLNVCVTTLKRTCRRLGVARWPRRNLVSQLCTTEGAAARQRDLRVSCSSGPLGEPASSMEGSESPVQTAGWISESGKLGESKTAQELGTAESSFTLSSVPQFAPAQDYLPEYQESWSKQSSPGPTFPPPMLPQVKAVVQSAQCGSFVWDDTDSQQVGTWGAPEYTLAHKEKVPNSAASGLDWEWQYLMTIGEDIVKYGDNLGQFNEDLSGYPAELASTFAPWTTLY